LISFRKIYINTQKAMHRGSQYYLSEKERIQIKHAAERLTELEEKISKADLCYLGVLGLRE
ncbi:hypothetical protein LCGC14_1210620, partial [marine sediment metagenome]